MTDRSSSLRGEPITCALFERGLAHARDMLTAAVSR